MTAQDFHSADTLAKFLELTSITIPPRVLGDWRRVPDSQRILTTLRGQPHQGNGVPEITDGITTWWRRVPSNELILVSTSNVHHEHYRVPTSPRPRSTSPRKPRTPLLLADFC